LSARQIQAGFAANNTKWVVELPGEKSAFVKAATDQMSAGFLRTEHALYSSLAAPFMPRLLDWHDDGELPVLVLEDLSGAEWPPPWIGAAVAAVLQTLEEVAASKPAIALPRAEDDGKWTTGWDAVAREPTPFVALGVAPPAWLERHLDALRSASQAAPLAGDALLHLDVRSDNLCIRGGRAVLVDWNLAARGNPLLDTAFWLPSLRLEGGPDPGDVCPAAAPFAASVAGFFACRAGLPPPATAPTVRQIQLDQLRVALPWAARALDLPPPG
jgi:aminoglycoside phosphotransferase (APT) family kinase protein